MVHWDIEVVYNYSYGLVITTLYLQVLTVVKADVEPEKGPFIDYCRL